MPEPVRILRGVAALLVLLVVATATAQNEQLRKVAELFQQQEYLAAQEALSKVERDKLDQADQEEYDHLSQQVAQGVAGFERADRDLLKAGAAFDGGRWDAADALYQGVLENEFARPEQKNQAAAQRQRIEERRKLAEAAEPGIVEVRPAAPPASQPGAESPPVGTPVEPVPSGTPVQPVPSGTPVQPVPSGTPVQPLPPGAPAEAVPPQPIPMGIPAGPLAPRRATPIEELRARDELLWQRAVALAQELAAQARQAVARNDYNEARRLAEAASERIEAARNYAEPVSKYLAARESMEQLRAEIAAAEQLYLTMQAERQREEIAERVARRREQIEAARCEKVQQLFNTACQLRKQQRFAEAAEVLRQVVQIDPTNAQARYQLDIAEDYASLLVQKEWQTTLDVQTRDSLVKAQEALIPWDVEVLYPRNWLELTARRKQTGVGIGAPEERELQRRLDEILPEFQFQDAPLGAVLGHLQDGRDLNMAVDWTDLGSSGIQPDRPVSLGLRDLPVRTVLKEVLAQAGGDVPLSYTVSDGVLRVATRNKLDREKSIMVYDVRDLLVCPYRQNNATRLDPGQPAEATSGRPSRDVRLFPSPGHEPEQPPPDQSADATVNQIMSIIRQTVAPDSWHDSGGGDGSIRELNGQLIVYQTSAAQAQVRGLLEQLRAQRAMQIAIEARFLDVTQNFLDEFGVDLDFVFNSGTAGYDRAFTPNGSLITDTFSGAPVLVPRQFTRIGVTPSVPPFGQPLTQTAVVAQPYGQAGFVPFTNEVAPRTDQMTPIAIQQNSLDLTNPANLATQVPGSFAQPGYRPDMSITGSFLDNLQVDFLIRATQANNRSAIVQAPRVVMNNASDTRIQIGRLHQYVATINATVAEGAALAQPVVNAAQSGTGMGVYAVISYDRRYVQVTINALTQADLPTFTTFETARASGNSPSVSTQLLDQGFEEVNTQVSIPDGGTVLLGGLKQVGEVEIEAGVPILSKVPVMNRFFTNRSTVKDTRTLLILMKAKIIIQQEAEEEAFPTFSAAYTE
jgi:general secretion pathway protein D